MTRFVYTLISRVKSILLPFTSRNRTMIPQLVTFAIIVAASLASVAGARSELPPVLSGNLGQLTAQTFLTHWADSADLLHSARTHEEADLANSVCQSAQTATHLAFAMLAISDIYARLDAHNKAATLPSLSSYIKVLEGQIDDLIGRCSAVAGASRRAGVVSEAEHLRRDLRTFKDYLRRMAVDRPSAQEFLDEKPVIPRSKL
jgi:hypothetical protein